MIKRLVEWFRAFWRGEKRAVSGSGLRGRVFVRKSDGKPDSGPLAAKAQPKLSLTPRRVWVDAEKLWYDFDDYVAKQAKG